MKHIPEIAFDIINHIMSVMLHVPRKSWCFTAWFICRVYSVVIIV